MPRSLDKALKAFYRGSNLKSLEAAGKSFEVHVGPDAGHSGIDQDRMMEFFIEKLVLKAPVATTMQ